MTEDRLAVTVLPTPIGGGDPAQRMAHRPGVGGAATLARISVVVQEQFEVRWAGPHDHENTTHHRAGNTTDHGAGNTVGQGGASPPW
jgi:hypothetical protein